MREICLAKLEKTRPVLVLTGEAARSAMTKVTVAPITWTRGPSRAKQRRRWHTPCVTLDEKSRAAAPSQGLHALVFS